MRPVHVVNKDIVGHQYWHPAPSRGEVAVRDLVLMQDDAETLYLTPSNCLTMRVKPGGMQHAIYKKAGRIMVMPEPVLEKV